MGTIDESLINPFEDWYTSTEEVDYISPTNLGEAKNTLNEINSEVIHNINETNLIIDELLSKKNKSIFDIQNIEWLSWKALVLWRVEDKYFISLTSNLWNYNKNFVYKFDWKDKNEVINKMNVELIKYNFEVPIESDDWR